HNAIPIAAIYTPPLHDALPISTNEDTAKAITLAGSDVDGDALTFAITAAPSHGTLSGTVPNLTYTPAANYNGADNFSFTVSDGTFSSAARTFSLPITTVNDDPV